MTGTSKETLAVSNCDGYIDIYPYRVPAPDPATSLATPVANINNYISSWNNYNMTHATYAPLGRYYWTHGITFTGSNQGIYLYCAGAKTQIGFQIINPNGRTSNLPFNLSINASIVNKCFNNPISLTNLSSADYGYSQGF